MKNLINNISSTIVKEYGITEVFVKDGEVYITSHYDIPYDVSQKIEKQVFKGNKMGKRQTPPVIGGISLGLRGDMISNDVYVSIIPPDNSLYDANGNVYWTNNTAVPIQPGIVTGVYDAGNGQYMLQVDTSQGPTPLNIGLVFTSPVTPGPNDSADILSYYKQSSTTLAPPTPGTTTSTPGGGGSPNGTGNDSGPESHGLIDLLKGPGIGNLNLFETGMVSILAIVLGVITVNQVTK